MVAPNVCANNASIDASVSPRSTRSNAIGLSRVKTHQLFDQHSAAFGSGADVVDIFQLAWTGFTFEFSGSTPK
ncbi:MAG: hypothetical protein IPG56_16825 [Caulobacteraceae bacterium]|nr:hypothetical protein [Caulobacteraceae bacterium]